METKITSPVPLLDKKGNVLYPGYANHMWYEYDPKQASRNFFRLKEWDFYQFHLGDWILQMTIGHISYCTQISANLFSLLNGKRYSFDRLYPLKKKGIDWPISPEKNGNLELNGHDFHMKFEYENGYKHFLLSVSDKETPIDIDIRLPWDKQNDKMVIATPFYKPGQFYLNCKEHYYNLEGHVHFANENIIIDNTHTVLLDWGRGVWPFHQEWFWGCGGDYQCDGHFGINIGWGFGDTSHATENMFFWNDKAYKLGELKVERDANNYMTPWHFYAEDGTFDMTMTPVFDNYTETKVAFINNHCHQVFGKYNGTVKLPDGTILEIKDMLAFCEHAENNW